MGLALLPGMVAAAPGDFTQTAKLTASDGAALDHFGWSVATAGDRVVVGAPDDDDGGSTSGSTYVYEPDGTGDYTETKVTASDAVPGDSFGWSVATAGDRIVVGAYGDDDAGDLSGSGYVYEPNGTGGFTETKLTASDAADNDQFGRSVATAGDRIVVGAFGGGFSGAAYVYEPDGTGSYTETKLTPSDAPDSARFGWSVATAGDRIVVGAHLGDEQGAAYVYGPDGAGGYTETKLTASDGAALDFFGYSVGIAGDRIVVGAYGNDDAGNHSGSAYVFEPDANGGYSETKLTASDAADGDIFGNAVATAGGHIVIAAHNSDDGGSNSGAAYVYEPDGNGGYTETKLTASDAADGDIFGYAVATAGDRIVVGAPSDDDGGNASGSAYVFEADDLGCTVTGTDGDDVLRGGPGDIVCGGEGNDRLRGGDGSQTFHGGPGDDTLLGESDHDILHGGPGNDTLKGGSGNDQLNGEAGDDPPQRRLRQGHPRRRARHRPTRRRRRT